MSVKELLLKHYGEKSFAEIANMAGCSKQRVGQIAKYMGLPKKEGYAYKRQQTNKRVSAPNKFEEKRKRIRVELLRNPFKSNRAIAKEIEVSEPTVYHVRAGLHKLWLANKLKVVQQEA